jgi:hypothetical protein
MGIFMPPDIAHRISLFIAGKLEFPFVKKDELIGAFYLYGKEFGVLQDEVGDAQDMAKKSVEQVAKDVRLYSSTPKKMDPDFTRENYTKRSLQIAIDGAKGDEIAMRVAGDPAVLSDCFAQHIAFHKQGYYFELFQPFKAAQLPAPLQRKLEGRMLLLGFNSKNRGSLPFRNILAPFFDWMQQKG